MTVLDLITVPNPILNQPTNPVVTFDSALSNLVQDMFVTMYHHDGIGLAAPQVGLLSALFVIGLESHQKEYINPSIIESSQKTRFFEEGCLSIPDVLVRVKRPETVVIKAQTKTGVWFEETLSGMAATVFQHEFDHLNGILILNYGQPKDMIRHIKPELN
jgi:peptide deformylase